MQSLTINLEPWQYQWLMNQSKKQSKDFSLLLRDLLTEIIKHYSEPIEQDPLWDIIGIAEGPDDGITSENLDPYLYQVRV